jgi:hypothetical protein
MHRYSWVRMDGVRKRRNISKLTEDTDEIRKFEIQCKIFLLISIWNNILISLVYNAYPSLVTYQLILSLLQVVEKK